ncbi:MAG: 30S ribosomal protein S27e [Thaumarchaeota archaeon]|nr:30S ribosomal protein S27e [Nitrososphaerota archaeon]
MQKERVLIPKPKSMFVLAQCAACGNEQVIFSHTTIDINCKSCGAVLASRTGGKAVIDAKASKKLDI